MTIPPYCIRDSLRFDHLKLSICEVSVHLAVDSAKILVGIHTKLMTDGRVKTTSMCFILHRFLLIFISDGSFNG